MNDVFDPDDGCLAHRTLRNGQLVEVVPYGSGEARIFLVNPKSRSVYDEVWHYST